MLRWTVHLKGGPDRAEHATVAVGTKVYAFGGHTVMGMAYMYNTGQFVTPTDGVNVHVFNTVSLRWMKLPPVAGGRGERPREVPSRRWGHTASLAEGVAYIWGGYNYYTKEYYDTLYAFDVDAHRWFRPKVSGAVPEARYQHSACVLGRALYVYGGCNRTTGFTDVYRLDTDSMAWTLVNARGTPPPVSKSHSATIVGTRMLEFGGGGGGQWGHSNVIRVFDTETNSWLNTPPTTSSSPQQRLPEGREGHAVFTHNGEMYVFGGRSDQDLHDMWRFDLKAFSWKAVEPKGKGPLWRPSMCCCAVGDRVVLFGGYKATTSADDLHILDLSPSLKTLSKIAVIQHGLKQAGLPHNIRWELAAMTTMDNNNNSSR